MDTKRIDDESYIENLSKIYKQQFSNRKFDLVIISDNNAFDFIAKYYDDLFKGVPVLFCGINNYNKEILEKLPVKNISGVAEEVDIEKYKAISENIIQVFKTSAKDDICVKEIFELLNKKVIEGSLS